MLKKTSLVFAFFCLSAVLISSTTEKKQKAVKTIIIDAGHGGHDVGAKGGFSYEKDILRHIDIILYRSIYFSFLQKRIPTPKWYSRK